MKKLKWNINKETVEKCLREAFNTYSAYLEDLRVELSDDEFVELCNLFEYKNCHEHINFVPLKEIYADNCHSDEIEDDNIDTFDGIIVIMNNDLIIDGNHRYNTLYYKYLLNKKEYNEIKIPVLNLYFEF